MKITFTIDENEARDLAEGMEIPQEKLTDEIIQTVLNKVEGDEMLAKDIRNSIRSSIYEALGE